MKPVFSMLAAAVLGLTPVVVAAQEPADGERVAIELNKLETAGRPAGSTSCCATMATSTTASSSTSCCSARTASSPGG